MQNFAFFFLITLCFHLSTINYIKSLLSVISGGENLKNITIFFVSLKNSCNFDLSVYDAFARKYKQK